MGEIGVVTQKKTLAIIQARMNSTRLPGKVLKLIYARPMLGYMAERVSSASEVDDYVIATSVEVSDDPIEEFCINNDIPVFRGNLHDVLDRFYRASEITDAGIIIRLTGDCPLVDPNIINTMVRMFKKNSYDYLANTAPPEGITFPEGMDIEIFTKEALKKAWNEAEKPSEREHVTFYFWKNKNLFSTFRYDLEENYSDYRLTVDYPEDFEVVEKIIQHFHNSTLQFNMDEIVTFLVENPEITDLNKNIESFSGWKDSLEKDKMREFES